MRVRASTLSTAHGAFRRHRTIGLIAIALAICAASTNAYAIKEGYEPFRWYDRYYRCGFWSQMLYDWTDPSNIQSVWWQVSQTVEPIDDNLIFPDQHELQVIGNSAAACWPSCKCGKSHNNYWYTIHLNAMVFYEGGYTVYGHEVEMAPGGLNNRPFGIWNESPKNGNYIELPLEFTRETPIGVSYTVAPLYLDGSLEGSGSIDKMGPGVLVLHEGVADNFTGSFEVVEGTLRDNAALSSTIHVDAGATLEGSGSAPVVVVEGHATLLEGPTFFTADSIELDDLSRMVYAVASVEPGAPYITAGSIDIAPGATLDLHIAPDLTPVVGQVLTLAKTTDGIDGTFAGLPEGALVESDHAQFRISYVGNGGTDLVLEVVALKFNSVLLDDEEATFVNPDRLGQRCALRSDGTIACWSGSPPPQGVFSQLSVGAHHACAIRLDGTIACWGAGTTEAHYKWYDADGKSLHQTCQQIPCYSGPAMSGSSGTFKSCSDAGKQYELEYGQSIPPAGTFVQVSAGDMHTCGIATQGEVRCWGAGTAQNQGLSPDNLGQADPPSGIFRSVQCGARFSCGIRADGTLACWGNNSVGQASPPAGTFIELAAAGKQACALAGDGSTVCWGDSYGSGKTFTAPLLRHVGPVACGIAVDGFYRCLASGYASRVFYDDFAYLNSTASFLQLDGTLAATSGQVPSGTFAPEWVNAGGAHTCVGGQPTCFGDNTYGQSTVPTGPGRYFVQLSAGGRHTCGLDADGRAECWGDDTHHQTEAPPDVFKSLSAGDSHTCGIRGDGTVACWGSNQFGQASPPGGSFAQLSAGDRHTCGVRPDGTVVCWGDDRAGQSTPPTGAFREVSAGGSHSCGLRADNTVVCWGDDSAGQTDAPAGSFREVSAGGAHTCAITTDSTAICWGNNTYGQATPPSDAMIYVSAGGRHTCGIRANGTRVCWGDNSEGQAVQLTIAPNSLPMAIIGTPYAQMLAASGGLARYRYDWSLTDGALPPGITLFAGTLAGTPTQVGSSTFSVRVATGAFYAEKQYTLAVRHASATTLVQVPEVSYVGIAVPVSAQVVASAGGGTPVGTVTIGNDEAVCQFELPNDTCMLAFSTAGDETIRASYAGSDTFAQSASAAANETVGQAPTQTFLAISANPVAVGDPLTFTAHAISIGGDPSGTVSFSDGQLAIAGCGAVKLDGDLAATCDPGVLTPGRHVIEASYSGNDNFQPSERTYFEPLVVNKAASQTVITSLTPSPSKVDEAVTIEAQVSPLAGSTGTPSGQVVVHAGSQSCTAELSAGSGSCQITFANAGWLNVSATYGGSNLYGPSSSAPQWHTVRRTSTVTTLAASSSSLPITLTATVSAASGTPTGSVTFWDGDQYLQDCLARPLAGPQATCVLNAMPTGDHALRATYSGDRVYYGSEGSLAEHVLDSVPPQGALTIDAGATVCRDLNLTLSLQATDAGGVNAYYVSSDPTLPATPSWVAVTPTQSFTQDVAYSLSAGDGARTVYAWYRDTAGNVSSAASATIRVDTTAPDTNITQEPLADTAATTAVFAFSSHEPGATFDCALDGGLWSPCPGGFATYTALADGPHHFEVRARDLAGNVDSTPASCDWTIDTAVTMPPVVTGPEATSDPRPTFSWTSGRGGDGTFRYQLDSQSGSWTETTALSFSPTVDLAAGLHVLFVQEQGAGSTWSASGQWSVVIDDAPPTLFVSTLADGRSTSTPVLNVQGRADDMAGIESLEVNDVPADPSGFSVALMLAPGLNVVTVVAKDKAGHQSVDTRTITYDPTLPFLEVKEPADNFNDNWLMETPVSGTVAEGASVTMEVDGVPAPQSGLHMGTAYTCEAPTGHCQDFSWDPVTLTNLLQTIEVTATDSTTGEANTIKRTASHDASYPGYSVTTPVQDTVVLGSSLHFTGTVTSDAHGVVIEAAGQRFTPTLLDDGSFAADLPLGTPGPLPVQVTLLDAFGWVTHTTVRNLIVDQIEITAQPAVETVARDASFAFTTQGWVHELDCRLDGGAWEPCSTGTASFQDLSIGQHLFEVEAHNASGTIVQTPVSYTWSVLPEVTAVAGSGGSVDPTSTMVSIGGTTQITVTAATGFAIREVSGCGGTLDGQTYTTAPLVDSCEITASFVDITTPSTTSVHIVSDNGEPAWAHAGDEITLTWTVSKATAPPTVAILGETVPATSADGLAWEARYIVTSDDRDGAADFRIGLVDRDGNAGPVISATTDASVVTIDNTAPKLVVLVPDDGSTLASDTVTVQGRALDAAGLSHMTINGEEVAVADDATFSRPLTLSPGSNEIVTRATDHAGNVTTDTREVIYSESDGAGGPSGSEGDADQAPHEPSGNSGGCACSAQPTARGGSWFCLGLIPAWLERRRRRTRAR